MGRRPSEEFPPKARPDRGRMRLWWRGRYYFLGPESDPEKWKAEYAKLIQLWAVDPNAAPLSEGDYIVSALCADYLESADCPAGERGVQVSRILRKLCAVHGETKVAEFDAAALKAWQHALCGEADKKGRQRYGVASVRKYVGTVRQVWKWGVTARRTTVEQWQGLTAVPGPRPGQARRPKKVRPADPAHARAALPFLRPPVRAMVELQLLTSARPSELFRMTPGEVHRGGVLDLPDVGPVDLDRLKVWVYVPGRHKTEDATDAARWLVLGRKAQAVLAPFLDRADGEPCFSPREAVAGYLSDRTEGRATKLWPSHSEYRDKRRARAKGGIRAKDRYDKNGYRQAVHRACDAAGVPRVNPYQLRHRGLSDVDAAFGLDAAQHVGGHTSPQTTRRYAKRSFEVAAKVARELG